MTRNLLKLTAAALLLAAAQTATTHAQDPWGGHHATPPVMLNPWHGAYAYPGYGQPVALVVPPTAAMHTDWSWGMSSTRVSANWHQFQRPFPGQVGAQYGFAPVPVWPSDTAQLGVYYIRGPW